MITRASCHQSREHLKKKHSPLRLIDIQKANIDNLVNNIKYDINK